MRRGSYISTFKGLITMQLKSMGRASSQHEARLYISTNIRTCKLYIPPYQLVTGPVTYPSRAGRMTHIFKSHSKNSTRASNHRDNDISHLPSTMPPRPTAKKLTPQRLEEIKAKRRTESEDAAPAVSYSITLPVAIFTLRAICTGRPGQ
jgi:hypothetical protein